MKKKINILCFSLLVLLSTLNFAQGPSEAYFPETANGATNIHSTGHRLLWENPDSTLYNKVYFSSDSILVAQMNASALLYNGFPNTVYDSIYLNLVEPLDWNTKYFWQVVEYYQSGLIEGPVWYFRTMSYPLCDVEEFFDDFENGLGNWIVTNDGGDCIWEIFFPPYPNAYLMPFTSSGGLLSADSDECGIGTSVRTTITLDESFGGGIGYKYLEFDNDWNVLDSTDEAYIEVSTNGGENWEIIWSQIGEDLRMTHEVVYIPQYGEILLRFRVIQPGWDWWWAIDNVKLVQDCPLTQFYPPHNLKLNTITQQAARVELIWDRLGTMNTPHFSIERKLGLPTDPTGYSLIGIVPYTANTFTDTSVINNNVYSYRIYNLPFGPGYSNEATAYLQNIVPVELQSFTAAVFAREVKLEWSTATETNNSGFEILRFAQNDSEWESIGFIPGFGTTTKVHHYSFMDESLQSGNYQYRLKQIDFDGTFEYSDIVEVIVTAPTKFSLEQNYPNPFNPTTKIKYSIAENPPSSPFTKGGNGDSRGGFVTLKVYDVLGNEVATLVNEQKPAGTYEIEFNGTGLASGIYFYQLKAGSFIDTNKMVLSK